MTLRCATVVFSACLLTITSFAQQSGGAHSVQSADDFRRQLELTQAQLAQSQQQIEELRTIVLSLRDEVTALRSNSRNISDSASESEPSSMQSSKQAAISEDEWQLLSAKVEEHQQTKVESGSKFNLKLSGMVLMNAFVGNGVVDNLDVPGFALRANPSNSQGAVGATLRQSIIGVTGRGPDLWGAKTSGDLQVDFFGGFSSGYGGASAGIARLRLARLRMDWEKTSISGGIDTPFISPNSPTSFMTVAEPAFANAGNMWSWVPSFRVERRFDTGPVELKAEAGILDPVAYYSYKQDSRYPTPGESSRQPAYSARISANGHNNDRPISIGLAGVYTPQWFPVGRSTDGWAGSVDWRAPLFPKSEISGEAFIGKGVEGFGGVTLGVLPPPDFHFQYVTGPLLARIKMFGGWSQFKYRFDNRNEVNIAAGFGGLQAGTLRQFALFDSYLTSIPSRNGSFFANYIFRPRSNLVFSFEYRKLQTSGVNGASETADHVGLAAGFLF